MARQKKGRVDASNTPGFGGGFADLLRAQGLAPAAGATPEGPHEAAAEPPTEPVHGEARLRRESKGRRGKTVVVVEGLAGDLAPVAKALRKRLGAGAVLEGEAIVVQGDQVDRVADALVALGHSVRARRGARG